MEIKKFVESLTASQKIALLTSGRTDEFEEVFVRFADYDEMNERLGTYPPFTSLAHTWNEKLIEGIAFELAVRAKKEKADAMLSPHCGTKMSQAGLGVSEDPIVAGTIGAACARGILKAGTMPVLRGCSLTLADIECMDAVPSENILRDYVLKPFEVASKNSGIGATAVSYTKGLGGAYRDVNTSLALWASKNRKKTPSYVIASAADPDSMVQSLQQENMYFLNGAPRVLTDAHQQYQKLAQQLKNKEIGVKDVQDAVQKGIALDYATLFAAAERFLTFASVCETCKPKADLGAVDAAALSGKLSRHAADETIILLKNDNELLPLRADKKLAVIGGSTAGFDRLTKTLAAYEDKPFQLVGCAKGYDADEQGGSLATSALQLAQSADAILLVIELGKLQKEPPRGCLALLDRFQNLKKPVIAVVSSDDAFDPMFAQGCAALVFRPATVGVQADSALVDMLTGKTNPSGRLAYTLYENVQAQVEDIKKRKSAGKIKIGSFFGYRHYDTSGGEVRYPFGHGLSYTTFLYSALKVRSDGVSVRVKNTGKYAGTEVVQVYVGKESSSILRPKKELKGFRKVFLKPGQSTNIVIPIPKEYLAVCDPNDNISKIEKGRYIVYVGSSVSDIHLSQTMKQDGKKIEPVRESLSEFIQTESNIGGGKYAMNKSGTTKAGKTRAVQVFSILALLAILLYDVITGTAGTFNPVFGIIFNLFGVVFFIAMVVASRNLKRLKFTATKTKSEHIVENARTIKGAPALEKMFVEEFKSGEEVEDEPQEVEQAAEPTSDLSAFLDKKLSLQVALNELGDLMAGQGIRMGAGELRGILSAMLSSRLVLLTCDEGELYGQVVEAISTYFGTPIFPMNALGSLPSDDRLFFNLTPSGSVSETAFAELLLNAAQNPHLVYIGFLNGVVFPNNEKLFEPLVAYAASAYQEYKFTVQSDRMPQKNVTIPTNVWLISVCQNPAAMQFPPFLTKHAAVVDIKPYRGEQTGAFFTPKKMTFHQLSKLCDESERVFAPSEPFFKKIDAIVQYAAEHAASEQDVFKLGNKEWRGLERFASAFLAMGGSEPEALDCVVAARVLPRMLPSMQTDTDELVASLEKILGENNASAALAAVARFGKRTMGGNGEEG